MSFAAVSYRPEIEWQFLRIGYEQDETYLVRKALEVGVSVKELRASVDAKLATSSLPPANTPDQYVHLGKLCKVDWNLGGVDLLFYTGKVLCEGVEYGELPILEVDPADYGSDASRKSIEEQIVYWELEDVTVEEVSDFILGRLQDCGRRGECVYQRSPDSSAILVTLLPDRQ